MSASPSPFFSDYITLMILVEFVVYHVKSSHCVVLCRASYGNSLCMLFQQSMRYWTGRTHGIYHVDRLIGTLKVVNA